MIKSMTGFGKSRTEVGGNLIGINIKSLNSKNLDFNLKAPVIFREKELEIRNLVSEKLVRGKVEMHIFYESGGSENSLSIDKELFKKYYKELDELKEELNDRSELFPIVTRIPDVLKPNSESLSENDWKDLKTAILQGLDDLDSFRIAEGASMGKDISKRIRLITSSSDMIAGMEGERTEAVKSRIRNNLEESGVSNLNEDRFEQELIYYLEKLDITEEKTRLATHCKYFIETMDAENSSGKKLNFISQEIGREINTIGSKANHAEIQKLVVQMKDELEKIKEQLLNVL